MIKLLGKATGGPPDISAHSLFLGIVGVAIATDSTHSPYWIQPALSLLQYIHNNMTSLAEVTIHRRFFYCTCIEPPPPLQIPSRALPWLHISLTGVLRRLVRKHIYSPFAHSMLLLWLLDTLVTHLPIVEVPTGKAYSSPDLCTVT